MSKKANPTLVGGFAIGALVLALAAVVFLGGRGLFTARPRAVAFFRESIEGLGVGAPVTIGGARVGTVVAIKVNVDPTTMLPAIPVYIAFEPERTNLGSASAGQLQEMVKSAIAKGLHARLESQSFVTGQLYVHLYFDPREESHLVGGDPSTPEIPTGESKNLITTLSNVPLAQISDSLVRVLDDLDGLVKSPAVPKMFDSFAAAGQSVARLTTDLDQNASALMGRAGDTLNALDRTLATADTTFAGARRAFASVETASRQADRMFANTGSLVSPDSLQRYEIDAILRDLSAAARSVRAFSDEIERRPNSIVLGK